MTNAYDIPHLLSFDETTSKEKGIKSLKKLYSETGIKYSEAKIILAEYFKIIPELLVENGEYKFPGLGRIFIRRYEGKRTKMLDYQHFKHTGEKRFIYDTALERCYLRPLWTRPYSSANFYLYKMNISIRCWRAMKKRIETEKLENNYPIKN